MNTTASRIEKICLDCGDPFSLEVPPDLIESPWAKRAAVFVRYCDDCAEALNATEHQQRRQAAYHRRIVDAAVPKDWRGLAYDSMDRSNDRGQVVDAAITWATRSGGFFLTSRPGTGKSRLAAIALLDVLRERPGHWINVPTLVSMAQADYRSPERRKAEQIMHGKHALVLDDLGKEDPTPYVRQLLQTALETRIHEAAHIFITSNLKVSELGALYGDWLASRLAAFDQWGMPGTDRRLQLVR